MAARALAFLAVAVLLAGCGPGEAALNDEQIAEKIENVAEARPAPKSEPPGPSLIAIRPQDLEAALRPGPGCEFSEEGRLVFVARSSGQTLARINGMAVRVTPGGPMERSGGYFANERYSISIGRLTDSGLTVDGTTTYPARLVLTDRRRREVEEVRIEGVWRCSPDAA